MHLLSRFAESVRSPSTRKMAQLVRAYQQLDRFSGAVLVAHHDRIVLTQGYGMANYEHAIANRPDTVFHLASLSKPFTALAILQLWEAGKLELHTPLTTYLPTYPNGDQLTLHHLLTNSSGIPDYVTEEGFGRQRMHCPTSVEALIASFQQRPLLFPPGGSFSYSNANWVLLGKLIEQISEQSFGDYLQEHIFAPAGMTDSGYVGEAMLIPRRATGYLAADGRISRAAHVDISTMYAAGGIHATVGDLHRWFQALTGGGLIAPDTFAVMCVPHVTTDDGTYGYGLAMDQPWGRRRIYHDGGMPGFLSAASYYPDEEVTVIVLSNFENGAITEIQRALAAILFDEPYELPTSRTFITVDPQQFAPLLGTYTMRYFGRTSEMMITQEDGTLWAEVQGLPKAQLRPLATDRYFAQMKGEVELKFLHADSEPAREIALNWAGHALTAHRVH